MSRIYGKINRAPIRSPSPDIANRSIITRTHSPMQEALTKSRQASFKKLPIGMGFPNIQQLIEALKTLQQKHKVLERDYNIIKQQNFRLSRQTQMLHYQNNKLQRQKLYSSSVIIQPDNTNDTNLIRQYEERIGSMMIQLKRIQEKLNIEMEKNTIISLENQNNKHKILNNSYAKNIYSQENNLKKKIQESQQNFKEMMKSQIREHQLNLKDLLQQLQRRQNKIQYSHSIIRIQIEKGRNTTPQKPKGPLMHESSTAHTSNSPKNMKISKIKGSEQLQKQNEMLNRKISILSKEVDRILSQNQDMKNYIRQSNNQTEKQINETDNCTKCQEYKNRILELQDELAKLNMMERSRYQIINYPVQRNEGDEGMNISQQILKGYLQELEQIKTILTSQPITSYISMIEQNFNNLKSIEEKIEFIKNQKQKIIQELKSKLMIQDMELLDIKRQNQTMKQEIRQLLEMNQNIKELIDNKSRKSIEYSSSQQNNIGGEDNWKLKKCLEEAIKKINHLENQIQMTLKN